MFLSVVLNAYLKENTRIYKEKKSFKLNFFSNLQENCLEFLFLSLLVFRYIKMIKPRCSIFLLFCLFSTFIITSGQDKGFLATFPTSVIPGDVAQFCIRFYNITEDVIVNINNEDSEFFDPIHETIPSSI